MTQLKRRLFATATAGMVCLSAFFVPVMTKNAYAAEDAVLFDETDVLGDLEGSTIGGKPFDVKDYPHNGNADPQIIAFAEFCYSYYEEMQDDYAFYVYVYNPQDVAFDTDTERNMIQFSAGKESDYNKYPLEFVRYSEDAGYEGRFFKFKVKLTDAERHSIWRSVEENRREYRISGIELSVGGVVEEYGCKQVYTYSGFALGYGSPLAENDTLTCTVDGLKTYLSLDVRSTYYRPKGTHADGYTRDTLHSVYFSVPTALMLHLRCARCCRTCSRLRTAIKLAYVVANTQSPDMARPAAMPIMFCSAMPTFRNFSGYMFSKRVIPERSARSAVSSFKLSFLPAISGSASPKNVPRWPSIDHFLMFAFVTFIMRHPPISALACSYSLCDSR